MTNYTEAQLNALNKTALVNLAIELGLQLVSYQSGPLKGSDVEKTMLDLARQAANIKSNDEARKEAHELALAKIESDKELAIKKIELEFADSRGLEAAELEKAYKSIEEKSKLAIEDLSFGLKKAELANKEAIDKLSEDLEKAKDTYSAEIESVKENYEKTKADLAGKIAAIKTAHDRDVEQITYDNTIAIRDLKLDAAEKIAAAYKKVVVLESDYQALVDREQAEEAVVQQMIEEAVSAARKELYVTEGAKYNALKSSSETTIALLSKDKEYLNAEVDSLRNRIESLQAQIVAFPGQLKDAVEAAKADVTINQDNKK